MLKFLRSFLIGIGVLVLTACGGGGGIVDNNDTPIVDTVPPIFTSPSTTSINENRQSAMTLVATDTSHVIYGISGIDANSFNVDENTGAVTFKTAPDYESGKTSYTFTATATDEAGNTATQNVTITILDVDETVPDTTAPVITISGENPITINVGQTYVDVGATAVDDIDGDIMPSMTGTVNVANAGTYTITYSATDTAGNTATATRTVVVNAVPNVAPTAVASATPTTATEGSVISFNGTGSSDSDGSITSYEWKEGSVVLSTAESFTKSDFTVGTHTVTLTVTDDDGATHSDDVSITIESSVATSVLLKKTGQTTSFYTGDDGYYQKGVTPSYSRANEVVTDHITGLQWQDNEVVEKKWTDSTGNTATAYCSNLSLDGGGWRLPTIKELQSIVVEKYVENGSLEVGIDTSVFVNYATNTYNYYWSSTTYAPLPNYALAMQLYGANMGHQSKFTRHYVRCVR